MQRRALSVRQQYEAHERERYGQPWSLEQLTLGLVGDVGDLVKLIQARQGVRDVADAESALAHELSDILWSLIVIAERCDVDLEASFTRTMDELDDLLSAAP
jgi:NTP pyrophosphatase (non-canonical NTP hydrolase)